MSLREKILIFSWQSIVIFDNGLLRFARNDDNGRKGSFIFYRFFKIFSFLPFQKVVIWNLLKNIVVIPLKDKKEKKVLLSSIDFRPIALRKNGRYCCLYEKFISYFKCKM